MSYRALSLRVSAVLLAGCLSATAAAQEVVATGLNNPGGLAFGPGWQLYVAESGYGGPPTAGNCFPNPEPGQPPRCYGDTGAIVRVDLWRVRDPAKSWERVVTGLPSLAAQEDNPATPFNDVGARATGPTDIGFLGSEAFALMGWGGNPADRTAQFGERGKLFGTVLDVEIKGVHPWGKHGFDRFRQPRKWRIVADIAAHEGKYNPDAPANPLPPDSNPAGLQVLPFRFLVADAGANTVVEAPFFQRTRTFAVLPSRCVTMTAPPFANPNPASPCAAGQWNVQSVPTSVTRGPDGAIYTTELTGFPFAENEARVYRTQPWGGESTPRFDRLTNVIDIAFDFWGNAYVLEIGHRLPPFGSPFSGQLIKVAARTGERTTLASDLMFPRGVAIGPDGHAYVTNFGILKGAGQVVRIATH